jgi:hypothetical protein
MFSNLAQTASIQQRFDTLDRRVYETFKTVGEQTDHLHERVKKLENSVSVLGVKHIRDTKRIENLETNVWFLKTLMVLMTVCIFCAMVLMRLDFEEAVSDGTQFDNYLQGKVRLFEKRFLDLEYP